MAPDSCGGLGYPDRLSPPPWFEGTERSRDAAPRRVRTMKIILSRKGFDSANGGGPSPIFPDGRLLSLPSRLVLADALRRLSVG